MKIKHAAMAVAVMGVLSAPEAWGFPMEAGRMSQSWGKVEFILHKTEGVENGYFFDARTGTHMTFMAKQAVLFLKGTVAIELGGAGNLNTQVFLISPSLNINGLFSVIPVLEKIPLLKPFVVGYAIGWAPTGIPYDKGVAHFVNGPRGGLVWKF